MLKRAFDVLSASMLLLLLLPLLAAAAIAVKLDSEGPAFFCQDRMGRRFRRFRIYKLRTMALNARGPVYTLDADSRITRVGRWLRLSKLDELPQLWNVIRGDMSTVGPRPVVPKLAMEFDWAYRRLLTVRPGLTDPASIKYCNECEVLKSVPDPEHYFKTVITPEKIRISTAYLQRATLWSDFIVILETALALSRLWMRRLNGKKTGTKRGNSRGLARSGAGGPFVQPRTSTELRRRPFLVPQWTKQNSARAGSVKEQGSLTG